MTLIDGKMISAQVRSEIAEETAKLKEEKGITPGLAVILVGDDPASAIYVRGKKKACAEVGFYSEEYILPSTTTQEELNALVDKLNKDNAIHGILCQLPLPAHLNADEVINNILPEKDVDAFHPQNVGKIMLGEPKYLPCTPAGAMELLKRYNIDVKGKNCVVIGRSNIVGKPMAMLLLQANGTVTICHSKTQNLPEITKQADIIVVAIGKAKFLTADMVKEGAVIVDVGINRNEEGKVVGDVDFENVAPKCSFITPVPGGVGPMTITMLLQNTLTSAKENGKN